MFKKLLPLLLSVVLFTGCTAKIVTVKFNQKATGNSANALTFQANGTSVSTETTQKAIGKLPLSLADFLKVLAESKNVVGNLVPVPSTPVVAPAIEVPPIVTPVPTPTPVSDKTSLTTNTVGRGNPTAAGPRELFKFSNPGSYYGTDIEVCYDTNQGCFNVPNGSVRVDLPDGRLWKPLSDVDKKLAIHGPGGVLYRTCTIKFIAK